MILFLESVDVITFKVQVDLQTKLWQNLIQLFHILLDDFDSEDEDVDKKETKQKCNSVSNYFPAALLFFMLYGPYALKVYQFELCSVLSMDTKAIDNQAKKNKNLNKNFSVLETRKIDSNERDNTMERGVSSSKTIQFNLAAREQKMIEDQYSRKNLMDGLQISERMMLDPTISSEEVEHWRLKKFMYARALTPDIMFTHTAAVMDAPTVRSTPSSVLSQRSLPNSRPIIPISASRKIQYVAEPVVELNKIDPFIELTQDSFQTGTYDYSEEDDNEVFIEDVRDTTIILENYTVAPLECPSQNVCDFDIDNDTEDNKSAEANENIQYKQEANEKSQREIKESSESYERASESIKNEQMEFRRKEKLEIEEMNKRHEITSRKERAKFLAREQSFNELILKRKKACEIKAIADTKAEKLKEAEAVANEQREYEDSIKAIEQNKVDESEAAAKLYGSCSSSNVSSKKSRILKKK